MVSGENGEEERRRRIRGLLGLGFCVQGFRCFPWTAINFFLRTTLTPLLPPSNFSRTSPISPWSENPYTASFPTPSTSEASTASPTSPSEVSPSPPSSSSSISLFSPSLKPQVLFFLFLFFNFLIN